VIYRVLFLLAIACVALLASCARQPATGVTAIRTATLGELREHLLGNPPGVDQFRLRGPFEITVRKDVELELSPREKFTADAYLSAPAEKAPLVIVLHGHDNSKDDHAYQAMHLATWGMHALALQLPPQGPWVANGRLLARVAAFIERNPGAIDARVDASRIVLAGHSFGAAAVAVALAEGAPAVGGILLDPSGFAKEISKFLARVGRPVLVVGADPEVVRVRGRELFYELIPAGVAEISIRGAHHDDGEFPMEPDAASHGTEELRITFVSALTSGAFSLGFTGRLDYAWASFGEGLKDGKMIDALRKFDR
jgi:dienelactone hydrolase